MSSIKRAIVVLGMHRSGTSALSGVLNQLGAQGPKTLMAPTSDNPKGYFESSKFKVLNDRILARAGCKWSDWCGINDAWLQQDALLEFADEMSGTIGAEFPDASLLVLKDPRFCLLAPILFEALRRLNIEPHVVLALRSPNEVARSLVARDSISKSHALLLWLRHVIEAERWTRGLPRVVLEYAELISDWRREISRIGELFGIAWPRKLAASASKIEEFLDPELRHHTMPDLVREQGRLGVWIEEAYTRCKRLGSSDVAEAEARVCLDDLRSQLDSDAEIYWPNVDHFATRLARSNVEIAKLAASLDEFKATLASNQSKTEFASNRANDALEVARRQHAAELADRDAKIISLTARLQDIEHERSSLMGQYDRQVQALIDEKASEIESSNRAWSERLESCQSRLEQVEKSEAAFKLELERMSAESAELVRRIATQDDSLSALRSTLETRTLELAKLTDRLAVTEDERTELVEERAKTIELSRWTADYRSASRLKRERDLRSVAERLESLIEQYESALARAQDGWVGRIARVVSKSRPVVLTAVQKQAEKEAALERLISESELFDCEWYTANVGGQDALLGLAPAIHYLVVGAAEGLDPSQRFSTRAYLKANPDVRESGENPLVHFLLFGLSEGRRVE